MQVTPPERTPRGFVGGAYYGVCPRTDKRTCLVTGAPSAAKAIKAPFLHPEQGDAVDSYQHRVLTDQATGDPVFLLATEANGQCVYLGASGCTIYDRRPLLCRSFDCRKHYLILPRQDRDNLVKLGLSSRARVQCGSSTFAEPERRRADGMPGETRRALLIRRSAGDLAGDPLRAAFSGKPTTGAQATGLCRIESSWHRKKSVLIVGIDPALTAISPVPRSLR